MATGLCMHGVRAILIDIDGVLTVSWRPLPGAVDAVRWLREAGFAVALLTNTTSRTRASIASTLTEAGFPIDVNDIFTAPAITAAYLAEHHPVAWCLLHRHLSRGPDVAGRTAIASEGLPGPGRRDDTAHGRRYHVLLASPDIPARITRHSPSVSEFVALHRARVRCALRALPGAPTEGAAVAVTQQYLVGELSVLLASLQAAGRSQASACDVARLRQKEEAAPLTALSSVVISALELTDALCWDSLTRGDITAFSRQAEVGAQLREFGICACLLADG
jgi:hypothetical protein